MVVGVLVEISNKKLDRMFDYLVPLELENKIKIGIRVRVPFASIQLEGFVLEINHNNNSDYSLKEIIEIIDLEPILTDELLLLGKYIQEKTLSTLISAYQVMLPRALKAKSKNKVGIKKAFYVSLGDRIDYSLINDKQLIIINEIKKYGKVLYSDIKKINSSVDTLIKKGLVLKTEEEVYRLKEDNNFYEKKELTLAQQNVVKQVVANLGIYKRYLLHGVTGSGKTEVYMEIIDKVLNMGKTAILLLPEISLTPQIVKRFQGRFPKDIAILHSGLSDGEKYDEYRKIVRGEVKIVIGARSAIFAPLENIGIIIVDECHSSSYKQDNMPKYDAIDIANYRGNYHQAPVLLGSATPSLELYARGIKGIYKILELKTRIGNSKLPQIKVLSMQTENVMPKTHISVKLYEKIKEKITKQEQVILLINRRGYHNLIGCHQCGYVFKCKNCDIALTYHKSKDLLRCHYCGYATNYPKVCPICGSNDIYDLGLGTEKIEEELTSLFKDVKVVRMDVDTTTNKGSHEKIIKDFGEFKYQILLGTQMIAKGLDFPNVTLVGVIDIDTTLSLPSYKSSENTFSLLTQVAGRSGRSNKEGEVIIQTFNPEHYAIKYASLNDYFGFYMEEMKNRKINKYPPYYYLVNILIKSKEYSLLSRETNLITSILNKELKHSIILGPTVAYPFKVNNICRFNILIKYQKEDNLYNVLQMINNHYINNSKIILEFAFNPDNI